MKIGIDFAFSLWQEKGTGNKRQRVDEWRTENRKGKRIGLMKPE
jgi:hypothetical protein